MKNWITFTICGTMMLLPFALIGKLAAVISNELFWSGNWIFQPGTRMFISEMMAMAIIFTVSVTIFMVAVQTIDTIRFKKLLNR